MRNYVLITAILLGGCGSEIPVNPAAEISHDAGAFTVQAEALQKTDGFQDCMKLDVTEADIRSVIAQSKRADGPEWHYNHVYPSCLHKGQIEHDGALRAYSYYPTGYLSLEGYEGWFMCYDCTVHPDWVSFDGKG